LNNIARQPLGYRCGFVGLVSGAQPVTFDWFGVREMIASGGASLTCQRHVVGVDVSPADVGAALKAQSIDALIVIGGFEGFVVLLLLLHRYI
jgi:6-phosphofructokinase